MVFGGDENYQVMNNCTFVLQTDSTITVGIARQVGMFTNAILNQNGHKLTLLGGGCVLNNVGNTTLYQLRFRYGYGITNAAEIVVDGGAFVAHNVTYWARPNKVPLCTVKNCGAFGPDGQSFADCFALVAFEPGTFVSTAGTSSFTMPPFEGCPYFVQRVTPTINKAWTVRANEIASGVALGTYNALTFGSSATLSVADCGQLDAGTSYVVATSRVSIAGLPTYTATTDQPQRWKTELTDAKTVSLVYDPPTGAINVRDWGVLPGAANAAANDAAFAAGLAALTGTGSRASITSRRRWRSRPQAGSRFSATTAGRCSG